jgi:hypothetical protein
MLLLLPSSISLYNIKKLIAHFSGWQSKDSTTHKRKEENEREEEKEKRIRTTYSHPKSMAKGLTLPR